MSRVAQVAATREQPRPDLRPRFNAVRCKQCGLCASVCPAGVLVPPKRTTPSLRDAEACNGCRTCEFICPDFAVKMATLPSTDGTHPLPSVEGAPQPAAEVAV